MHTLQSHVTNLELSKRLKEHGAKQESYFWWSKRMDGKFWRLENREFFQIDKRSDVSAFLASEIGERLPNNYMVGKLFLTETKWGIWAHNSVLQEGSPLEWTFSDTMSDALGEMYDYLLVHKLI